MYLQWMSWKIMSSNPSCYIPSKTLLSLINFWWAQVNNSIGQWLLKLDICGSNPVINIILFTVYCVVKMKIKKKRLWITSFLKKNFIRSTKCWEGLLAQVLQKFASPRHSNKSVYSWKNFMSFRFNYQFSSQQIFA